jgi:hypothetical protein
MAQPTRFFRSLLEGTWLRVKCERHRYLSDHLL